MGIQGADRPGRARRRTVAAGGALARAALVMALTTVAGMTGAAATAWAQNPVGVHSMLQLDDPPSFMQAMFAQAAAMHASAIRLDVAPALIFEDGPSQPPDFSGLDEVMSLAQAYRLRVVADLMTIPPWMADCAAPTADASRCATNDLAAYGSVISQIVAHADPVIHDWEVWNEPDTAAFFDGTPQQYAFMLQTAHDAITAVDPADDVLLGGISGPAGTGWLGQVLATPGADAAHAFDTANVHERGDLWSLATDLASWRQFFAAAGFTGPLWVTEHGYPSDPAYQYDPGYTGGEAAQAAYLAASIPTLVDAGAAEVLVTERDNLTGPFASEGVLGGEVQDPPVADPQIVAKPSFSVVGAMAGCFQALGRDCPGAPATASPATLTLASVPPGSASSRSVTVGDPGAEPIALGPASITGPDATGLSVAHDGCAGVILEPRETCSVTVQFRPAAAGDAGGRLGLGSDDGPLVVALSASAPSVSALRSPQLTHTAFTPIRGGDGIGYPQRWSVTLTNPLSAPVSVARAILSGPDARRFRLQSDRCAPTALAPHGTCALSVLFTPTRAGIARAQLTLEGIGTPWLAELRAVAYALPTVRRIALGSHPGCPVPPGAPIAAAIDQPSTVHWRLAYAPASGRRVCGRLAAPAGAALVTGTVRTGERPRPLDGARGYPARWRLGALRAGRYVLTVIAADRHGTGPARSVAVTIGA
ncbi:MAG: choice-of-anchor D domain-containing protein [Solirubrobacteraceae bacterium]